MLEPTPFRLPKKRLADATKSHGAAIFAKRTQVDKVAERRELPARLFSYAVKVDATEVSASRELIEVRHAAYRRRQNERRAYSSRQRGGGVGGLSPVIRWRTSPFVFLVLRQHPAHRGLAVPFGAFCGGRVWDVLRNWLYKRLANDMGRGSNPCTGESPYSWTRT